MTDLRDFLRPTAIGASIVFATTGFLVLLESSVPPLTPPPSQRKPERTNEEREARIAKAAAPEPTTNPPIEPNDAIIGHWRPECMGFSGEKIQFHADGTFDYWQYSCINIYDDFPIHGRYLFDGTEIRVGVEDRLRKFVWTRSWFLWKYDGDTFLVTEHNRDKLDMNDPATRFRLHIREGDWDDTKRFAFHEAFWNRYLETVPANACYPANVE